MGSPNTKPNHHIMFSLQQNDDDLVDHSHPCLISFQQQNQTLDLDQHLSLVDRKGKSIINYNPLMSCSTRKEAGSRGASNRSGSSADLACGDGEEEDRTQKKMAHREIERQRRQEMAKLYASLRDLLPIQFIKGNRSISDHMHKAVHYITQMEENVKALTTKRDQLLHMTNNENLTNNNMVSVSLCDEGLQVLMNSCLIEDGFMLSKVLKALVEEGFHIKSCILTKVNDRLLHSIQMEASDLALIDLSMLQERLVLVANPYQPNFN